MTGRLTRTPLAAEVATLDPARIERLRRIGWLLDRSIRIPGTRITFGLDPLVGLIPGIGDLLGGLFSLYIILEAARLGAPRPLLARMGWNVALDTLVGEVPILGDLFDVGFKSNVRNLALLDQHVQQPVAARRASAWFAAALIIGLALLAVGAVVVAVLFVRFLSGLAQ